MNTFETCLLKPLAEINLMLIFNSSDMSQLANFSIFKLQPTGLCSYDKYLSHLNGILLVNKWDLISMGWPTSHMKEIILLYRISIASKISCERDIPLRWDIPPHMKRSLESMTNFPVFQT